MSDEHTDGHPAPTWETCRALAGQQLTVHDASDRPVARLWLETVTTPVPWREERAFSVLLTGPVSHVLAAGVYRMRHALAELWLRIEQVAADVRYAHYEAYVLVPAPVPAGAHAGVPAGV